MSRNHKNKIFDFLKNFVIYRYYYLYKRMFKKYIFIIVSVFLFTSCFSSNNNTKTMTSSWMSQNNKSSWTSFSWTSLENTKTGVVEYTKTWTLENQTWILNENKPKTKTGTIKTTSKDNKTEEQVVKEFEGELDSLFKLIEENAK